MSMSVLHREFAHKMLREALEAFGAKRAVEIYTPSGVVEKKVVCVPPSDVKLYHDFHVLGLDRGEDSFESHRIEIWRRKLSDIDRSPRFPAKKGIARGGSRTYYWIES